MENKIKSFGAFIHTELNESEFNEETDELIDEGWKEILVAGALALSTVKGMPQSAPSIASNPKNNIEYVSTTKTGLDKMVIDFGSDFLSGRYKIGEDKSDITESKLKEIGDFMKVHQSAKVVISIAAGESQVPNKDFEAGKVVNGDYPRLPVGALATNRAEVMKKIVTIFMTALESKGVVKAGSYEIVTAKPTIGTTVYKPGDNPRDAKFTAEQFVKVTIEAKAETKDQTTVNFKAYATDGEMIYVSSPNGLSHEAIGEIRMSSRATTDITNSGGKDTGKENMLLQTIDRNGKPTGKSYVIPWQWWNETVGAGHYLDAAQWQHIQQNFQTK